MAARVTSVFLYVKDVRRSLEFYNEVVGAEVMQVHAEHESAPYSLAILRIGQFTRQATEIPFPFRETEALAEVRLRNASHGSPSGVVDRVTDLHRPADRLLFRDDPSASEGRRIAGGDEYGLAGD